MNPRPDLPVVRFFNTYEPVTDFYRDLIPALFAAGLRGEVMVSRADYRTGRGSLREALTPFDSAVTEIPAGFAQANTRMRKLLVSLSYTLGCMFTTLFGRAAQVNFFLTQPPLFALWGRALRILRGTPYCCLVMDLYPHVLAAHGLLRRNSWAYRLARSLMLGALKSADRVFVIGRCMRDLLVKEGIPADRIVVVCNWANESTIFPIPRSENRLAARYGIRHEFVVLYSGNIGISHDIHTIVGAIERLSSRDDIRFVFFGAGQNFRNLVNEKGIRQLDNLTIDDLQPTELLALSQSLGDVHFVTLRSAFSGVVVPSKAYSALASGRPLIYEGGPDDEVAQMVVDNDVGGVVSPGDVDSLVALIENMADNQTATAAMGQRARVLSEGKYGRRTSVERYVRSLQEIIEGGKSGKQSAN
jgi:colanic acid biosynthesis glycosyl transferase WcaI